VAKRLYGNLFGLWDRLVAGGSVEPAAGPSRPAPPPPVPPAPTAIDGRVPDDAFVEAAFRHLSALPDRERQRKRDRFEQRESDLLQAVLALKLTPEAEQAGLDLAFELWAISELALGDRLGRTDFGQLRAGTPAPAQPALERYLDEWLGEAMLDETEPLSAEERAKLEPLLRSAIGQLAPGEGDKR
jgi:hypothetical protein